MAKYKNYLSVARNQMNLLDVHEDSMPCSDCGCLTGPETTWLRLNDRGIEFIGFLDLTEYLLTKYKASWTVFFPPIVLGYILSKIFS